MTGLLIRCFILQQVGKAVVISSLPLRPSTELKAKKVQETWKKIGDLKHKLIQSIRSVKSDLESDESIVQSTNVPPRRSCTLIEDLSQSTNDILSELDKHTRNVNIILSIPDIETLLQENNLNIREIQSQLHSLRKLLRQVKMANGNTNHKKKVYPRKCKIIDRKYLHHMYGYMLKSVKKSTE